MRKVYATLATGIGIAAGASIFTMATPLIGVHPLVPGIASLVPLMAKGKESARIAHISFNVLALGLFTWQIPTGWEITQKVIANTKFPW